MNGLLTFEDKMVELIERVSGFFSAFSFAFALEILILFCLIFYVSKILRDNDATRLMVLYWVLILAVGVMSEIESFPLVTKNFLFYFVIMMSMFILVMFNVEVKKSLLDMRSSALHASEKNVSGGLMEGRSNEDVEKCISDIIKALQNMSKNNVGGLVVLSRNNLPRQVLQSGVMVDAEISSQLIEGIFFPKAPLHDGAMIIRGHKIQAAGCFLPLTQKTNYPKDFGTRHRAGIGITEVANVISIVISEETGIISVIKQGNVQRYADYDMLKAVLKDYYWHELPLSDKKR
ncbi:MAG: diadenylate cyclase [Clostridia bacterium]|nr:diadenylate cyclase [Clostridia bacterium]